MATRAFILDGSKVREQRERHGLNQPEFARRCGITQPTLAHIEGGRRNGSPRLNRIIAEQLGVALDAITTTAEPQAVNQ